ncbi:MAG: antitoxin [Gemmatimonadetes bacterium]|nr:antitoxin [Gemmatimonadota bacterium]
MARIQVPIDEPERERFRQQAEREGRSLAAWLREAAREKLVAAERAKPLDTLEELRAFFAECDGRESGTEPDWEQHRRVIEASIRSGSSAP